MYVRHLSVADFRSWASADVTFEPGPTVLVGANGQGKTMKSCRKSLADAIALILEDRREDGLRNPRT